MQSGLIPDESLTASSWSKDYRPLTARFNYGQPGWMSSADDSPQWLQVELNQDETLTHVATQSLFLFNIIEFCKSYTIHYRNASSGDFDVYMENGHPRVSNDQNVGLATSELYKYWNDNSRQKPYVWVKPRWWQQLQMS